MKIIFESEEEKERFVQNMANVDACPTSMLLEEIENCKVSEDCLKCWRYATSRSNVSMADKNLEPDPVTERDVDDPVEHPAHYTSGEIECIDALKASMSHAEFCGFLKGNAMKYLWRYDKKGKATEDLEKSRWYLDRLWAETKSEV